MKTAPERISIILKYISFGLYVQIRIRIRKGLSLLSKLSWSLQLVFNKDKTYQGWLCYPQPSAYLKLLSKKTKKITRGSPPKGKSGEDSIKNTTLKGVLWSCLVNNQKLCLHSVLITKNHCVYPWTLNIKICYWYIKHMKLCVWFLPYDLGSDSWHP